VKFFALWRVRERGLHQQQKTATERVSREAIPRTNDVALRSRQRINAWPVQLLQEIGYSILARHSQHPRRVRVVDTGKVEEILDTQGAALYTTRETRLAHADAFGNDTHGAVPSAKRFDPSC
jgi:hypothetical protein